MSYINPEWIDDEHAEYITDKFAIDRYQQAVDRKMNAVAVSLGVPVPSIPTDVDGYVTSLPFQEYGIILLKMKIWSGYWGRRSGNKDIYYQKMHEHESALRDAKRDLTKENICDATVEDETLGDGFDFVSSSPY